MRHLPRWSRRPRAGNASSVARALGRAGVWAAAVWAAGLLALATPSRARAAEPRAATRSAETAAELARVDRELRELRATLTEVQRSEREHFEVVRRLLDRRAASAATGRESAGGAANGDGAPEPAGSNEANALSGAAAAPARPAPVTLATVTGRVTTPGPPHDVYVYLEGFRSNAGRKAELEIVQTHKSFEPSFAVALAGTRASFPNRDTFFHNVFSTAPTPFDLGTYRADEKAPSVTLSVPGVVEIFCNIHAQMQAQILVVPNRIFARVADDGTFRLDKVPAGRRKLVAWGPGMRPVRLEVSVPAGGTKVSFDLEPAPPTRHLNKFGLPYGAYKD